MFGVTKSEVFTFLNLYLIFAVFTSYAEGNCVLRVSLPKAPHLTKTVGSKVTILSNYENVIKLNEKDQIGAYCASGFSPFQIQNNAYGRPNQKFAIAHKQKLNFECRSYRTYVSIEGEEFEPVPLYHGPTIGCKGDTYLIFESKDALLNCPKGMSYLLAVNTTTPIVLAGFCYDFDKLKLNYVTYRIQNQPVMLDKVKESYPVGISDGSLMAPINIRNLLYFPSGRGIINQPDSSIYLRAADYEKANIVQTFSSTKHRSAFKSFPHVLDIYWWRPLMDSNWNYFDKALTKRAETMDYIIYSGTSGAVQLPEENNGVEEIYLEEKFSGRTKKVPLLVWIYLQSSDKKEDFVVIGYNSPYFDFFPKSSTILCEDMCDDIDWMKQIRNSRFVSTLGVVYCCHPKDVAAQLDGFPKAS